MILREMVERFSKKCPFSVMLRATLENVLSADRVNSIFVENAQRQSNETLMFSTVADIMGLVASRMYPSVNAAYKAKLEEAGVTAKAVYDKLQRVEGCVSRAMVRDTVAQLAAIISKLGSKNPEWLAGYRVKILDGNHLQRTERRIKELRVLNSAPLPGHAIAVLDPFLGLVTDVFPCEDGHAQERTLLPAVLETVTANDLWIGDSGFCTTDFLWGIKSRRAYFVIRQHSTNLRPTLIGKRKKVGRTKTGMVYEQSMQIADAGGNCITTIRRITVQLDNPTRDSDTEIHILTNLPKRITAIRVAELYLKRWAIETAFGQIALNLHGEIESLGYPKAALFGFCMALLAYNLLAVMKAAICAAHGETAKESLSIYYVTDEIAHTYRALEVIPKNHWERTFGKLSPTQLAKELIRIAKTVDLVRYRKQPRGPKKEPPKMNKKYRDHVSTARILNQRVLATV